MAMVREADLTIPMNGILNLDKPASLSSARAVSAVKHLLPRGTKVGHAGTLDPFATGVLLVLVGRATKLAERLMDAPKQYTATLKFGATTATDDLDSPEQPFPGAAAVNRQEIDAALPAFIGTIQQRPPAFSALKVGGRRAYKLARSGRDVPLSSRPVRVYGIELLEFAWPVLKLRIDCGRGTYIRALARDLGEALGCGAYLTALCRTRVGPFDVESAAALHDLTLEGLAGQLAPDIPHSPSPLAPPGSDFPSSSE
jgi:tRNA pseudouridine55 synthase